MFYPSLSHRPISCTPFSKPKENCCSSGNRKRNRVPPQCNPDKRIASLHNLCGLAHYWLRAMTAAARINRNLAQAFRTLFGGGVGGRGVLAAPCNQGIDRGDHKEVNCRGDQQKADYCSDKVANGEYRASDGERDPRKIGLARQQRNNRVDDVLDEGGNDGAERRADHHAHGQIHYIAAQDELLKSG